MNIFEKESRRFVTIQPYCGYPRFFALLRMTSNRSPWVYRRVSILQHRLSFIQSADFHL